MNNFGNTMPTTSTNLMLMKPIILTASIIGCLQAFIWGILSIIPIVIYNGKIKIDEKNTGLYPQLIYIYLLDDASNNLSDKYVMRGSVFNIFMYFYLVISFLWLVISCFLFHATKNEHWNNMKTGTISWTIITVATSALDIITMGMFISDYITFDQEEQMSLPGVKTILLTMVGIMMSAAARGYVLWVVNVVFAITLAIFAYNMQKQTHLPRRSLINAYGASPRAFSLYEETNTGQGKTNEGFKDDEHVFPRNRPEERSNLTNYQNFQRNDLNSHKFQTAPENKFAHIGKPSGAARLPPEHQYSPNAPYKLGNHNYGNIPPSPIANNPPTQQIPQEYTNPNTPYIPYPDYSPPNTPKGQRSVLKPRSRYE